MNNLLYGNYRTRTLNDIYSRYSEFEDDFNMYKGIGLNPNFTSQTTPQTIFYLLSGKYGNSHIANSDENQFKLKLFSTIFQFGPTWEKRLDIQSKLRGMNETDILTGSKQINDHAYNPSTEPSGPNVVNGEITSVNEQSKIKYTKSKVDAYASLYAMLETDVTEDFLGRFKKLFLAIVEPEYPLWYITDINEEE